MTPGYAESYLEYAKDNLGTALDYCINGQNISGQEFLNLFVSSGIADEFASGNSHYILGMTGRNLADEVFTVTGKNVPKINGEYNGDYTPEYWCGWALAHYQWATGLSFKKILSRLSFEQILNSYSVLHEADTTKMIEIFDTVVRKESFLALMRKSRNYTQAALANESGVSLRSVQLYEQRKNDIGKAQYNHLRALAEVLNCSIYDILEE